ncbi:MAG: acylglycerol kinase family protein, partial [candidate division KSB1 bacterium]|nr:acylglycerol kinase family protein [candidate division KSB1 bacterium]
MKKVKFIINPVAGFRRDKRRIYNLIRRRCNGWKLSIKHTAGRGEATRIARQAAEEGYDLVVAVGGDGTVNEV